MASSRVAVRLAAFYGRDKKPLGIFAALALVILLPLLAPGYVLTVDMVFTPVIPMPNATAANYPLYALLHVLSLVLPSQFLQKVLLVAVLFLSGYGMYRLARVLQPDFERRNHMLPYYFAGVLYVFNPFVYSRFMAGQLAILLGYSLLPWTAAAIYQFLQRPTRNCAASAVLCTVLVGIVSIHTLGLVAILAVAFATQFAWQNRSDKAWRKNILQWGSLALIACFVLSSYWLVPTILGHSATAQTINGFTDNDLRAFAASSRGFGVLGNVLGLQGFWADSQNLFMVPQDVFGWWFLPTIVMWLLVILGIWVGWRKQRDLTIMFVGLGTVATILAVGTAGTWFAPLNHWLVHHLPFFAGYREPQKFVALLVLLYAYFASLAVAALWRILHAQPKLKQHAKTAMGVLFVIPLLYAPLILFGFHGQLHAAEYPVEWSAINDRLDAECTGDCKVLFLPWHLYMRYDFAGRIIADPAPLFFGSKIVSSSDPEIKDASAYAVTPIQRVVTTTVLPEGVRGGMQMGRALSNLHIRYVLLAKENDYQKYGYLKSQTDLRVVMDTPTLTLYEVQTKS